MIYGQSPLIINAHVNENLKYILAQVVSGCGRSREGRTWMNEIGKHDLEQTSDSPAGWFPLETTLVEAIFEVRWDFWCLLLHTSRESRSWCAMPSLSKYLLSNSYVTDTVLATGDTTVRKSSQNFSLLRPTFSLGETEHIHWKSIGVSLSVCW